MTRLCLLRWRPINIIKDAIEASSCVEGAAWQAFIRSTTASWRTWRNARCVDFQPELTH